MTTLGEEGIRYSDDPKAYLREWMRRKRKDPEVRKQGSLAAREWQRANPLKYAWNNSRTSARTRGYEWALDRAAFDALLLSDCTYCGAKASPVNGIDRIDNAIGYVPSNVTAACADCNYAKRKMSRGAFIAWANRVVQHSKEK